MNEFKEPSSPFGDQSAADSPPPIPPRNVFRLWFGVTDRVGRLSYAVSGFTLAAVKYAVEAIVIWSFTDSLLLPWQFLNPVLTMRMQMLQPAPEWLAGVLLVWTLPFLWIAISMSVRRAADSGASPWLGLLVLIPLINIVLMLVMCARPSLLGDTWSARSRNTSTRDQAKSAAIAVGASLMIGAVMLLVSVYVFSSYGSSVFLGTPVLMAASASYLHNRHYARGLASSIGVGAASIFFAATGLMLFALEGFICIAMALPLMFPLGVFGALIGKAIANATRRPPRELIAAALLLPIIAGGERLLNRTTEYEVLTVVEVNAPPEVVWKNVIAFPDLPDATEWYFRLGVASPQRARIVGEGVGATRYCEFTTGTFVEPITTWDPPRRLAFDVTEQPAPMFELSPYQHVHPPHLDGFLRSNRGEFRLRALPGNRTRLEGRTWYEFAMFPQSYWTAWSHLLIHRIHLRVLRHIQQLSELE